MLIISKKLFAKVHKLRIHAKGCINECCFSAFLNEYFIYLPFEIKGMKYSNNYNVDMQGLAHTFPIQLFIES